MAPAVQTIELDAGGTRDVRLRWQRGVRCTVEFAGVRWERGVSELEIRERDGRCDLWQQKHGDPNRWELTLFPATFAFRIRCGGEERTGEATVPDGVDECVLVVPLR